MSIYYILYQLNVIDVFFEAMRILIPGFIKILLENGIIFMSNIRSVLMGGMFDIYCLEEGKQEYKVFIKDFIMILKNLRASPDAYDPYAVRNYPKVPKIKDITNYKRIIDEYILEDYFTYNNNSNSRLFRYEYWYDIFRTVCLNIETMLILNQKLFYEYGDYINNLYNWFSNFKILIDKSIINSNIVENLYYNISLELLMDVQSEPSKSLLFLLQNSTSNLDGIKKDILINLLKNYFLVFKQNPYKVQLELLHLYKYYPRSTTFSYGIDYDINIWKSNKYNINNIVGYNGYNNKNIIANKNINTWYVINKKQWYFNNMMLWSPKIDRILLEPEDRLDGYIINKNKYKTTNWSNLITPNGAKTKFNKSDNTLHLDYHRRKRMPWYPYGGRYYFFKKGANFRNSKTPIYEFLGPAWDKYKKRILLKKLDVPTYYFAIDNKFNKYIKINAKFMDENIRFMSFRTEEQLELMKDYYIKLLQVKKHYRVWVNYYYYGITNITIANKTQWYVGTGDKYRNFIREIFYNKSADFIERKDYYIFQGEDILKNPEAVKVFGGYSYWWGWHQDAIYIHGRRGAGGAPLWDDYIRWRLDPRFKNLFVVWKPKYIFRMRYGVDLTANYGVKRSYFKYAVPWSVKTKTKFLRYLLHGSRVWEIEKVFFKKFLLSDDMWMKTDYRTASKKDPIYNQFSARRKYSAKMTQLKTDQPLGYYKLYINSPKLAHYKWWGKKWTRWFFVKDYIAESYLLDQLYHEVDYYKLNKKVFSKLSKISNISSDYSYNAMKGIRGFLTKKYFLDFWFDKYKIVSLRYLHKNTITWDTFYTNIENIAEPFTLSYINKNYYGRHMESEIEGFLVKESKLVSNLKLPKNTNLLLKKTYIESLIYVYQREEEPMINYIKYKRIYNEIIVSFFQDIINIIYSSILDLMDTYKFMSNQVFIRIWAKISSYYIDLRKGVLAIQIFENILKFCYKYIWDVWYVMLILFIILVYCVTSSLLVLIIKSSLPKNLVYGIKVRDKIKFLIGLGSALEPINRSLPIKNYFDTEHRYIYRWDNRLDIYYCEHAATYENRNSRRKFIVWKQVKGYNKFEEKKINDVRQNYVMFYKTFLFEKNLSEKWETNTKIRVNIIEFGRRFANKLKTPFRTKYQWWTYVLVFLRVWYLFWKDRRYNHNRKIVWSDTTLEKESKVWYYMKIPKLFFDFFFYIKFILQSLRVFELSYWTTKWRQYMTYGLHFNMNYKDLRTTLEREWSLDWYKDNVDFGAGILYKEYAKVIEAFDSLKKFDAKKNLGFNRKMRNKILLEIIKGTIEKDKLQKIIEFKAYMKDIKNERYLSNFEVKLKDIKWKLVLLETSEISPKVWAEQIVRHKFINEVFLLKKELIDEEQKIIKLNFTQRVSRDLDDEKKTVQVLTTEDWKRAQIIYKKKLWEIEYERKLRDSNFKNKIVDKALDLKDKSFYESIKEYNKELSDEWLDIEQLEKERRAQLDKYEVVSTLLYSELEKYYIFFRWFTTMGSRLNYLLSLIITVFAIWTEHLHKVRKNEYSTTSLIKIILTDASKFIYKIYWEYILIFKKYKTFSKLGYNIIDILKFSLLLTPLLFIISNLYLILFIYIYIINFVNIERKNKINKVINNLFILVINNIIIKYSIIYVKNIIKILNILFRDIETGNTIFDELYKKLYKFCGWIQRNIFFIKGAFDLGYNEDKNINKGLKSILKLFKLKYYAYIEKKKNEWVYKKNIYTWNYVKKKIISKKTGIFFKLNLIYEISNLKYFFKEVNAGFAKTLYKFVIKPISNISYKEYAIIYNNNMKLLEKYYKKSLSFITWMDMLYKKFTWYEIIWLYIKWIWGWICLPFKFIVNHQKWKYIKNYKQGIKGFRDNPMYLIADNPKFKNDWQWKLHNILIYKDISNFFKRLKTTETTLIEIFLKFKIAEVTWTGKNIYQDFFWKNLYFNFKLIKAKVLDFIIKQILIIEESYISFETSLEMKNWTLWQKCKYAYYMYRANKYIGSEEYKLEEKRMSRDLFFYKKTKEKKKILRIYFFKGIINWFTYITINKVIFKKKIKKLKPQKIKTIMNKYINYNLYNLDDKYHISQYIEDIPPQFWALFIIYDKYYRFAARYFYSHTIAPVEWKDELQYTDFYKWRLNASESANGVPYLDRRQIAIDRFKYDSLTDTVTNLRNECYDPLLRWVVFLFEYGYTSEDFNWDTKDIWADISMTHLLTFNPTLNAYNYEIKEFKRMIDGTSFFFRWAEDALAYGKNKFYEEAQDRVRKNLEIQHEDILKKILQRRQQKRSQILHKALRRYEIRSEDEKEYLNLIESEIDYFYKRKLEFFESVGHESQMEGWKSDAENILIEDKYYGVKDLENTKKNLDQYYKLRSIYGGGAVDINTICNDFYMMCFDQTLEEIYYFLEVEVWKLLEKELKKNKLKKTINYKNLTIKPTILYRINWDEHVRFLGRTEYELKKKILQVNDPAREISHYMLQYDSITWPEVKFSKVFYNIENHVIWIYYLKGDVITYTDKIRYNEFAINFRRKNPYVGYHENNEILFWASCIKKRRLDLQNIKEKKNRKKKKNKCKGYSIALINHIKWNWLQWIGYGDTTQEDDIFNKNIILLNEKYRIWNIKRGPIRIKLPVELEITSFAFNNWVDNKGNYSGIDQRYFLMAGAVTPIITQAMNWEIERTALEKKYNKDVVRILMDLMLHAKRETFNLTLHKEYIFIRDIFLLKYRSFHKLYFAGMAHYSWDLLRYWDLWAGLDDYTTQIQNYFKLKQEEFLIHDPVGYKIMGDLEYMAWVRYNPFNYYLFFTIQHNRFTYFAYNVIAKYCLLYILYIIFYNPAAYLSNMFLLGGPLMLFIYLTLFRHLMKDCKELSSGKELYLYKYHVCKPYNTQDFELRQRNHLELELDRINTFYTHDEQEEIGFIDPLDIEKDEYWWQRYSHLDKNNNYSQYLLFRWFFIWFVFLWWWTEWWSMHSFKYRNHTLVWEYYRYEEAMLLRFVDETPATSYKERSWLEDSYTRAESGGNIFSLWYENTYRRWQGRPILPLDYGKPFQKVEIDSIMPLDLKLSSDVWVNLKFGFADAFWIDLGRILNIYIPSEMKRDRWQKHWFKNHNLIKMKHFDTIFTQGYMDSEEIDKYLNWNDEYNVNFIEYIIFQIKFMWYDWLIGYVFGVRHKPSYKPIQAWFNFQKKMIDWYDYDMGQHQFIWGNFLFDAKKEVAFLVKRDYERYFADADYNFLPRNAKYIVNYDQRLLEKMQKHPLITGKSFNMQQVLLMSEEEKHLYVIYYNFSKYKVNRLDLKLKYDEDLQFKEIKNKLIDIKEQKIEITAKFIKKANREDITYYYGFIKVDHATADRKKLQQMIEHNDKIQKQMEYNAEIQKLLDHNDKVQKVVDYKLSIELFSKQCEHYINNIFINISNKDKIENRYNLFMTLWNEEKWSWDVVKAIFQHLDYKESFDLVLKILITILE